MGDLPAYPSLAGASCEVLYALMAQEGDPASRDSYEFWWQRDQALIGAVDGALGAWAAGHGNGRGGRPSLASISQAPGGSAAVIDLLNALLPQLPIDHRGLNRLLDLLRDETLRYGRRVDDPALFEWLTTLSRPSAAAKTACGLVG